MTFTAEFILQLVIAIGSGFGAYAAIRADLAALHEKAANATKTADQAHRRIDDLMGVHRGP